MRNHAAFPLAPDSLAVHAGRDDFGALGVHAPPLDLSSTYPIPDLEAGIASFDELAAGGRPSTDGKGSAIYARLHNPTVDRFERALAQLEGGEEGVAFGSGMAAMTACLLAASRHGRHVIAVRPLYGGTDHLLTSGLLDLEVSWVGAHEVGSARRPDTSLVIVETPANPTLALIDIADVVRQAAGVPVLVDSTFMTPVLQRPLAHGATLVLHSATKFLGGHGDVVAGAVVSNAAWARELRQVRIFTGGLLHPLGAYLLHRGLPTLPLRVRRAQATARRLARRLAAHPAVERVLFPGISAESDPAGLLGTQMAGPGSVLSFELRGGFEAAAATLAGLRLITSAVSLGSTDSLIQHPAGLTHRALADEVRRELGITPGLLRLSVGLEAGEDLWQDLRTAIDHAASHQDRAASSAVELPLVDLHASRSSHDSLGVTHARA